MSNILKFMTCGSVDDGKSTLIGRLLYDSNSLYDDQLNSLKKESIREELDFSLLVDGLQSEREQKITIDIAHRYFNTKKRKFIILDTPGHEQYTRNMVTGASSADLAIILIDARKGVLTQTKRHSKIVNLMGIKRIVVAINKIDLVSYCQKIFDNIKKEYLKFAKKLNIKKAEITFVPISALYGDNVVNFTENIPWYRGKTIIDILETTKIYNKKERSFRFLVQYINRANLDFRGYCGDISSGKLSVGDEVVILPSNKNTKIKSIITYDKKLKTVKTKKAITLLVEDDIDISRGDMIVHKDSNIELSNSLLVSIIWMDEKPLELNTLYEIKRATTKLDGYFEKIEYIEDINSFKKVKSKELNINEIAKCRLKLNQKIAVDRYKDNKITGAFIVIDKISNNTVAAGMVESIYSSKNIVKKPYILWFTGLSGSGKTTIANSVESALKGMGYKTYILDGDILRDGLNQDLGFGDEDRSENIRRVGEVSKLFMDAGVIVLATFISPFQKDRRFVKELVGKNRFIEVFIDTPLEICQKRDPKGLYKKVKNGEIKNFTGIDSDYEAPLSPKLSLKTEFQTINRSRECVIEYLRINGFI